MPPIVVLIGTGSLSKPSAKFCSPVANISTLSIAISSKGAKAPPIVIAVL